MTHTITLPDALYARLQSLARPFVDKEPADVIARLIEDHSSTAPVTASKPDRKSGLLNGRAPRERGATVSVDDREIRADTVADLCRQVFDYLISAGKKQELQDLAPYKTSSKRYLFSASSKHPNGNEFFAPIAAHGLYIETHKNYHTTVTQLERLCSRLGIDFRYVGN